MKWPQIPHDWTGEEAMAVADCLQGILDSVWALYGAALADQLCRRSPPPDELQKELPF
jgi:hypothetical protein